MRVHSWLNSVSYQFHVCKSWFFLYHQNPGSRSKLKLPKSLDPDPVLMNVDPELGHILIYMVHANRNRNQTSGIGLFQSLLPEQTRYPLSGPRRDPCWRTRLHSHPGWAELRPKRGLITIFLLILSCPLEAEYDLSNFNVQGADNKLGQFLSQDI
jgi:hypothetical protein